MRGRRPHVGSEMGGAFDVLETRTTIRRQAALEAAQGQMDGSFSQLPYKYHLEEVASVGD